MRDRFDPDYRRRPESFPEPAEPQFGFVACTACGYTDLYRVDGSGKLGTVFDVLSN